MTRRLITTGLDQRLGSAIRDRRISRGLSQKALGTIIGTSGQMVEQIEKGHSRLTVVRLVEIANALGWSVFMLLTFVLGEHPAEPRQVSDRATMELVKRFSKLKPNERSGIVLLIRKLAEGL